VCAQRPDPVVSLFPVGFYGAAQQEALWLYYEVFLKIMLENFYAY